MDTEQLKNIDLSVLDKLSPAEKELALSILKEYSATGKSDKYNDLLLEDYAETPTDILTFVDDYNYLGNAWHDSEGNSKLYPYWRKELLKIFPNNLETNVNNAIFSGSRGRGKAQPLDAQVFTETGYRRMGDLKVGDKVYGDDGKLHPILGIYPQGKKDAYEVICSDSSKTVCSDEHLWYVRDNDDYVWKTLELKDMLNTSLVRKGAAAGIKECRYKLPLTQPLQFKHRDTFISPYLMGCLLGDGCFSNCITLTTYDEEIRNYLKEELDAHDYEYSLDRKTYIIKKKHKYSDRTNLYKAEIIKLGLYKHTAEAKFIPDVYLFNDIESRIALLQGLMDTDGTVVANGSSVTYSTCSKVLAEQVVFIVQSLGGTAHIRYRLNRTYKNKKGEVIPCKDCFTVALKLPTDITPFRLSRKIERLNPDRLEPQRNIKELKYLGKQECQCIYLDYSEHLYLTDDLIVTHNTEVATLVAAYLLHRILCLKDPIAHFHLKPTEKIVFAFMNIKLALAEEIGVSKFQNTLQSSPWFMNHGTLEGRTKKLWVPQKYNGQVAVDIKIGSQSDDLIGLPVYFAFFDEISFIKNQDVEKQKAKAYDMIDTAIGGMKTRFVHKGKNPTLLVLASSKRSDKSFLEEHMKKKLKSEKENVYVSDGSVWQVKPPGTYSDEIFKVALGNKFLQSMVIPDGEDEHLYEAKGYKILQVPVDFRADFIDDIDRALCDFAGISSSSISKYINAQAVTDVVTDRIKNPFTSEILEIGNGPDDEAQYYNFFDLSKIDPALRSKPLFIHLDMSISGDKTGIAGVFIRGKKPSTNAEFQSNDLFYSLAFAVSIKAPKGRQVSFDKNRNFIYWLKEKGFNIKGITTDTFQSYDTGQTLQAKGYPYQVLSVDRVDSDRICKPYQYFKNTIYDKRIELFDQKLLFREITELERNIDTGKVDHPEDGCFTGETKVQLVDGRSLSFYDLVDEFNAGKENYVYSINLETKRVEPKRIVKAWLTKKDQQLVRLTFDNGEVVECTLNHRFMLRNGEYIEAQNMIPGESLMPLYTRYPEKGGLKDYYDPFGDGHQQLAKLRSIEFIDKRADVYDIEVEDNHNFALAAGVFVHNSKDACDAVCGAVFNASKHAEEFAYDYGESLEGLLRANDTSGADGVNELTLKLEDELRNMRGVFKPKAIPGRDPGTTEYSLLTDDIIIL